MSETIQSFCKGTTLAGTPCKMVALYDGYCSYHTDNDNKCMAICERSKKRCSKSRQQNQSYCVSHIRMKIDQTATICQGKYKHGEQCTRPAQFKGLCGVHCLNVKMDNFTIPVSTLQCAYEGCTSNRIVDIYCPSHHRHVLKNELLSKGLTVCTNWSSGCFNQSHGYASCEKCLAYYRYIHDKTRNRIIENNKINIENNIMQCFRCRQLYPVSHFNMKNMCTQCDEKLKNIPKPTFRIRKTCIQWTSKEIIQAYNNVTITPINNNNDDNENIMYFFNKIHGDNYLKYTRNINYRFDIYSISSKNRQIPFNLTEIQSKEMFLGQCFYCHHQGTTDCLNGINLMITEIGYVLNNCVSCCRICSNIKRNIEPINFLETIKIIINHWHNKLTFHQDIESNVNKIYPIDSIPSRSLTEIKVSMLNDSVKYKHNYTAQFFQSDLDKYKTLPCYICNRSDMPNDIDKFDQFGGYVDGNIEACCGVCRYMKRGLSFKQFIDKLLDIYCNNQLLNDMDTIINENSGSNYISTIKIDPKYIEKVDDFDVDLLFFASLEKGVKVRNF